MTMAATNHLEFVHDRPKTNAGEFYIHPYGGIAREIWVTREGFARFFGFSLGYIDRLPMNQKLFNEIQSNLVETMGYKMMMPIMTPDRWVPEIGGWEARVGDPIEYKIVIIDHRSATRIKFHQAHMRELRLVDGPISN